MKGYIIKHLPSKSSLCYLGTESSTIGKPVGMYGFATRPEMLIVFRTKKIAKQSLNVWCSWNVSIFPRHFKVEPVK